MFKSKREKHYEQNITYVDLEDQLHPWNTLFLLEII